MKKQHLKRRYLPHITAVLELVGVATETKKQADEVDAQEIAVRSSEGRET